MQFIRVSYLRNKSSSSSSWLIGAKRGAVVGRYVEFVGIYIDLFVSMLRTAHVMMSVRMTAPFVTTQAQIERKYKRYIM